jgi:putative CRISPR-associated protein (TIGR02620 family)
MKQREIVIVTRHAGLVEVLAQDFGIVGEVVAHATEGSVRGKDVYGVLPLHLAACAASVTEVTLNLPADKRGAELSADEVRQYMVGLRTFVIRTLEKQRELLNDALDSGYQGMGGTYSGKEGV